MAISDNIRTIRKQKGLTQKQVAEACGMFDAAFRAYELGKANPKPATVARIAKALGVSAAELYGVDWVPGIETPDQETNSALYQSLLLAQGGTLPIDDPSKARLIVAFDKLNKDGQLEAIKRVEEMGAIPAYRGVAPTTEIQFSLTAEEKETVEALVGRIDRAKHEISLMGQPRASNKEAMRSSNELISATEKELGKILASIFLRMQQQPVDS